jgi:hypothetical protein
MKWGRPQPETVCDYAIDGLVGDRWISLVEVSSNYQRRRRHAIQGDQSFTSVRVTVTRTNGLDHARICGVYVRGAST